MSRKQQSGPSPPVAIGPHRTAVTLDSGPAVPFSIRGHRQVVRAGHPVLVSPRRPDLQPTRDLVRCGHASASSSQRGADPLAAVDGSPATGWQPSSLPADLTAVKC